MLEFHASRPLTVGVELEFQLLNARSLELADGIQPLMEYFRGNDCIKPEMVQETVEVASLPCDDIAEVEAQLIDLVSRVAASAERLNLRLCGSGTHPFTTRFAAITPRPRYLKILDRAAYLAKTRVTYATHVHLGMPDPDTMIRVNRDLVPYLPMLVALSANSPFWHGCETGYASYRQRALAAVSSYGIPPTFDGWEQFLHFYKAAKKSGMCSTIKDLHWDIRPQPGFGTVEVRTMDAVATIREAVALASFLRTLVAYLLATPPEQRPQGMPKALPWWANRENHFRASHRGTDAECLVDEDGSTECLRTSVEHALEIIAPTARDLGEEHYLTRITQMLDRPGYKRQRATYDQTGSLQQVSRVLVDELAAEIGGLGSELRA